MTLEFVGKFDCPFSGSLMLDLTTIKLLFISELLAQKFIGLLALFYVRNWGVIKFMDFHQQIVCSLVCM